MQESDCTAMRALQSFDTRSLLGMSLASTPKTPCPKVDVVYVLHFYNLLHNWLQCRITTKSPVIPACTGITREVGSTGMTCKRSSFLQTLESPSYPRTRFPVPVPSRQFPDRPKKPTPCRHRQSVEWASGADPGVNAVDETAAGEPADRPRSSSGSIQEPTPTMPR